MLKTGTLDQDRGADHVARREKPKQSQSLVARIANLGSAVSVTKLAA